MSMTKEPNRRAAVLRGLERSGLSMAEFCRREELPYSTVAAWRSAQRRGAGRFIEVESAGAPAAAEVLCAELVLPGGAVLRVFTRTAEGGAA
jgi:transposase-like protein